jgi:hypothetical protein
MPCTLCIVRTRIEYGSVAYGVSSTAQLASRQTLLGKSLRSLSTALAVRFSRGICLVFLTSNHCVRDRCSTRF